MDQKLTQTPTEKERLAKKQPVPLTPFPPEGFPKSDVESAPIEGRPVRESPLEKLTFPARYEVRE